MALAALRRHINLSESPLYRLPPDLVSEVASHLTSETDLVNATHVSYHLRNTLLSQQSLWSHLDFKNEMRARMFFELSGQTPLHIDLAQDIRRTVASLPELRRQSKRIATLKLRFWSIQKMFLSEPLPSLRRLEIFYDYYYDENWEEEWDDSWAPVWGPTEKATSWTFPSLTTLVVRNLNPVLFHTPRLTRLRFHDWENPIDTDKLLIFLDNCSLLEDIDISYLEEWNQGQRNLAVSLPSLRNFTQTTFYEACPLTVFNMLSLTPLCSVTLKFQTRGKTTPETDDTLPRFKNPGYLADIKRVKLRTTHDAEGNEVAGTLELINTEGTMVRSERMDPKKKAHWPLGHGSKRYLHNGAHLDFLKMLDGRSVETVCIDGCALRDGVAVEFLMEALGLGNVKTLILCHSATRPCLSALDEGPVGGSRSQRFSPIHTLIIRPDPEPHFLRDIVLKPLLSIALKRKVAGCPFRSVLLFLSGGERWGWGEVLDELKTCVEKLEVVMGDEIFDWDVDEYFLDGLDHLQNNRRVEWD